MKNIIYLERREIILEELSLDGKIIKAKPIAEERDYFHHYDISGRIGSNTESLNDFIYDNAPEGANACVVEDSEFLRPGEFRMRVRYYRINLEYFVDGEKIEK